MISRYLNEFSQQFDSNSYNRTQLGNDKPTIIKLYEYLERINVSNQDIITIIENIAYQTKEKINISLFTEIITKSLGFRENYDLDTIINVSKEIHDIYFESTMKLSFEEYSHELEDYKVRKLFLNPNNKYILKNFKEKWLENYIKDLKFASACALKQREYQDFVSYIDEYDKYQETYSPLLLFKTYKDVRKFLKEKAKLFWDILFGNEYIVSLVKNNISVNQIYRNNVYKNRENEIKDDGEQLDIFSYKRVEEETYKNLKTFQLTTIYNTNKLPNYQKERDILAYYKALSDAKENIILPKLKGNGNYLYNIQ